MRVGQGTVLETKGQQLCVGQGTGSRGPAIQRHMYESRGLCMNPGDCTGSQGPATLHEYRGLSWKSRASNSAQVQGTVLEVKGQQLCVGQGTVLEVKALYCHLPKMT